MHRAVFSPLVELKRPHNVAMPRSHLDTTLNPGRAVCPLASLDGSGQ
jgi:hypothetical protein